jgi:molybdate transport system ATP-binding protein
VAFRTANDITVVCGPSGAGKSSLLLAILGALPEVRGHISLGRSTLLDSERGIDLPVRERRVGMVLQDAPLFPHLDVLHNVAFGMRGPGRLSRARAVLERVGADDLAARGPHELSGGQTQRVALARALGSEPAALLLDEPFSALDPPAREALGQLLVELQLASRIPFVHVTHDLAEALRLGQELVLLDHGGVTQKGPPAEVIAQPASLAAARAVGTENLLRGRIVRHLPEQGCSEVEVQGTLMQTTLLDLPLDAAVTLGLRAEDILLSLKPIHETSARNVLSGTVRELTARGPIVELRVTTPASLRVLVTPVSVRELSLEPGREVCLLIKASAVHRLL